MINSCVRSLSSSSCAAQTQGSKDNASSQSPTLALGAVHGTASNSTSSGGVSSSGVDDRAKLLRAVVPCQQTLSLLFDARHIGAYVTFVLFYFTLLYFTLLYFTLLYFTLLYVTVLFFAFLYSACLTSTS